MGLLVALVCAFYPFVGLALRFQLIALALLALILCVIALERGATKDTSNPQATCSNADVRY